MHDEYQPIRGGNIHRARKLYGGKGAFAENGGMYSVILMGGILQYVWRPLGSWIFTGAVAWWLLAWRFAPNQPNRGTNNL